MVVFFGVVVEGLVMRLMKRRWEPYVSFILEGNRYEEGCEFGLRSELAAGNGSHFIHDFRTAVPLPHDTANTVLTVSVGYRLRVCYGIFQVARIDHCPAAFRRR